MDLDSDIAKVDPKYLLETLTKLDTVNADALFISCTALPVLKILDEIERKTHKPALSSNQTLIWDTIRSIGYKSSVKGYGKTLEKLTMLFEKQEYKNRLSKVKSVMKKKVLIY